MPLFVAGVAGIMADRGWMLLCWALFILAGLLQNNLDH